ncbi:MAG: LamG-like jellyroll fold domain-containing protein [Planctomycetota bacterium]|jgi:hypothetical protein
MFKRLILLTSLILMLGLPRNGFGIAWTNADPNDELWNTPNNWDGNVVPTGDDTATLQATDVNGPLVQDGVTASCFRFQGPGYELPPGTDLTITGGSLTFGRYWRLGFGGGVGTVNMSGGRLTNLCNYAVEMSQGSTFNLSGGTVETGFWVPSGYSTSFTDVTTFHMTGGMLNAKDPNVAEDMRIMEIGAHGQGGDPRPGLLNLYGGTIIVQEFLIGPAGQMDITEGTLIIDTDVRPTIEGYVSSGVITAYGGAGVVVSQYDDVNDVTVVTAASESPFAFLPVPANRSTGVCPDVVLQWSAGDYAAWHDVYLGTDFNDVNDANDPNVLPGRGRQGLADTNYAPEALLDWGTTYYWRIDEVNDACEPYLWKGMVWSFTVDSGKAKDPSPESLDWRIPIDTNLVWQASCLATSHDVYLGTDFNDVNDATDPNALPGRGRQDPCNYNPGGLAYETTYYWRIDEVGEATFVKGDVWSFETIGPGETLIMGDISAGTGTLKEGWTLITKDPYKSDSDAVTWEDVNRPDGSSTGIDLTLDVGDSGNMGGRTWGGEPLGMDYFFADDQDGSPDADFIVELDDLLPGTYRLTTFHNNTWYGYDAGEINDVTVAGGVSYSAVLTPLPATQTGSATDAAVCRVIVEFDATGAEAAIIRYKPSEGNPIYLNGLILDYFPPDKRYAHWPTPRDGSQDVQPNVVLSWWQGIYAADPCAHDVYFGTNSSSVSDANTAVTLGVYKGSQDLDANTYRPPELLELSTTYYWRIDENNDANNDTWKGNVWRFTTADFIIIDDFENYTEGAGSAHPITDGWTQGYLTPPYTGSIIDLGLPHYGAPVRGQQSMTYVYDNMSSFYSETGTKSLDPCDWTHGGVKMLSLWFHGENDPQNNDANETEQMYIGLEDNDTDYAEVRYPMEDMNDIRLLDWTQWNIPLSQFSSNNPALDLTNIETLYIGFGDRNYTGDPGGGGIVYFDDIRLYPPTCIPSEAQPDLDWNNDCIVDFGEIQIMADDWLESDVNLGQVTEPCDANLIGWWKFDEGAGSLADDSSDYDNDGTIETVDVNVWWVAGPNDVNYALDFDGGRVRVSDTAILRPANQVSASAWIKYSQDQDSARVVVKGPDNREAYGLEVSGDDKLVFYVREHDFDPNVTSYQRYAVSSQDLDTEEWMHIAGSFDGNSISCYINGQLAASADANFTPPLSQDTNDLAIGSMSDDDRAPFRGTIDDVRIYDYGLSPEEIAWLATDGIGTFSVQSIANLVNDEPLGKRAVNLRDFDKLADAWLEQKLWPE